MHPSFNMHKPNLLSICHTFSTYTYSAWYSMHALHTQHLLQIYEYWHESNITTVHCYLLTVYCGNIAFMSMWTMLDMLVLSFMTWYGTHLFAGTAQFVILLRSDLACAWAGILTTTGSLHYLQTCLQTPTPWSHCELGCAADAGTGCCAAVWSAWSSVHAAAEPSTASSHMCDSAPGSRAI
jgi:hypothetical protein